MPKENRKLDASAIRKFKEKGMYKVARQPDDNLMFVLHKAFREDPVANPDRDLHRKTGDLLPVPVRVINALGYSTISPIAKYQVEDPAARGRERHRGISAGAVHTALPAPCSYPL